MSYSGNMYRGEIPVIRKNYDETKSAKFRGKVKFICNEFGIIYRWYLELEEVWIDRYTTRENLEPKNKNKRPSIYEKRTMILTELGLKEEPRPTSSDHSLKKLDSEELKKLNLFFKNKYNSTLKNTLVILKGNNPGGEASKPSSAEMITTSDWCSNIVILFDALHVNNKDFNLDLDTTFTNLWPMLREKEFIDILKDNKRLKAASEYLQKNKTQQEYRRIMIELKEYVSEYRKDLKEIERKIKSFRSTYRKDIDKNISTYPSYVIDVKDLKYNFEKAHIWNVWQIKEKIIKDIYDGYNLDKAINNYKKYIIDVLNYVPLPGNIHRMFDKNKITYCEKTGEMICIDKQAEYYIDQKYKKINENFFRPRAHYFKRRNEELNLK